ncbi:MAG: beta-ribofuranosylaminobenzene 5'-phosphate synthase family protein [Promethearchaeota archaeon]
MMKSNNTNVTIRASARLHLGFIDLHGGLGRKYGSLGVSLQHPICVVEVNSEKTGLQVSGEHKALVKEIANRTIEHFGISTGLHVTIRESIPRHVGLGSGTQLGLAVATGITMVAGIDTNVRELATILERGIVSGVGTATFALGGFVVDGGKPTKQPTQGVGLVPPVIIRHEIPPDWYFVVVIPKVAHGLSGIAEKRAFQDLPSAKPESAMKTSRLLIMKLIPAIIEDNLDQFGDTLTQIQIIVGEAFASTQGGRFAYPEVSDCVDAMLGAGAKGAGQSSWGPTCYGLVRGTKAASEVKHAVSEILDASTGGMVFISTVNNQGAKITSN